MSCCGGGKKAGGEDGTRIDVQEYYGKVLKTNQDLKTDACSDASNMPLLVKKVLGQISDEVMSTYYGCGLVVPDDLENLDGLRILDLGSGSGRDCFLLSKFVGEQGHVLGVDMTENQIQIANRNIEFHREAFGYSKANVSFKQGYIENLADLGLEDNSFDIVISNCVINLSPKKEQVLREVYRVLKPGGEFYFSDVYADRRVPKSLQENKVLWGECISGALYWNDFITLAKKSGFRDPRLVEDRVLNISNVRIQELLGLRKFFSATFRLWKLEDLEGSCEDFGQAVIYNGKITSYPDFFRLDHEHTFLTGKVSPVCGNTLSMIRNTRLQPYFTVVGDGAVHYGIFEGCGKSIPFTSARSAAQPDAGGGCC
mmetsp:Transcript_2700/g.7435  ORF Transcript_2700/g.7435 Transcript_2700/m.7435 type:complete len:370 (-) Transcript_2700:28-1137(-)|eukprot:CAMPEP_0119133334 /NCGR_PEP_ID=MMETSP1310-20130426/13319_1 /TAXON_ID=464262 /ORGANISM="Genus nov. species nov., Strain RCC2339" /LENGTH=369 /DNA_ID=CAMNT_0007124021 /DNA_START=82 /DNA_END=1191 /DNA_ORIENTATION=+